MIKLWENPVNLFPMGNSAADHDFLVFIYCKANPVLTNADLLFPWIPLHLFKVSEVERVLT